MYFGDAFLSWDELQDAKAAITAKHIIIMPFLDMDIVIAFSCFEMN